MRVYCECGAPLGQAIRPQWGKTLHAKDARCGRTVEIEWRQAERHHRAGRKVVLRSDKGN